MSRSKQKTAVTLDGQTVETENSLLGRLHTRIEELEAQQEAEKQARQERKEQRRQKKPSERLVAALNGMSRRVHGAVMGLLSNLRLSLVLRVALYASGQLLRTTLPMLLAVSVAFFAAQAPALDRSIDRILTEQPAQTNAYDAGQLTDQPFSAVYVLEKPLEDDLRGWPRRVSLFFSEIRQGPRVLLYENTILGGTVFVWELSEPLRILSALLGTLLAIDLLRVGYFIRHRKRLNQKVLKPITDMAETAATLSANNLSDRISVEGTKNELKDLALVINGMLDRIELSYNSQKQFVSDASHELRTPIAVIQGYISMLQRWGKTDPEVLDEGITAIAQETASMKELVERLLFLARHDKKTLLLEMEDFDPLEIMSELHREAKMLSSKHAFALTPADNAMVHGDKGMMKQLMRILLDNAIKYTPEGGSITLGMKNDGDACVLSVEDTGAGIAPKDLGKIFDRFYRCDEARKSQQSGHGLGLSIARIIASAHGGKITVRSKVGVGTTFSVRIPTLPQTGKE